MTVRRRAIRRPMPFLPEMDCETLHKAVPRNRRRRGIEEYDDQGTACLRHER
jgi:hypothetical protein